MEWKRFIREHLRWLGKNKWILKSYTTSYSAKKYYL